MKSIEELTEDMAKTEMANTILSHVEDWWYNTECIICEREFGVHIIGMHLYTGEFMCSLCNRSDDE